MKKLKTGIFQVKKQFYIATIDDPFLMVVMLIIIRCLRPSAIFEIPPEQSYNTDNYRLTLYRAF